MEMIYTRQDADAWAAFSGDYNPIHFDVEYARRMGLAHLSVHGMRALLDMKRALSVALLVGETKGDAYAFSARLRQPVLCQTPYRLQVAGRGAAVSGTLANGESGERCFSSKLAATAPLELEEGTPTSGLTALEMQALVARFPGEATDITQAWSFLDALLFQQLVVSPATLATFSAVLPELTATTLIDVFAQLPVVQTHHDVHFSARLLTPEGIGQLGAKLQYVIAPMLVMGDRQSGFVLRAAIQARTEQQPLMTSAITLKTWPLA